MGDIMNEKEIRELYYQKANSVQTLDDFVEFANYLKAQPFDYSACVYAGAAIMKTALKAVNLGYTGFQAGCIFWELAEFLVSVKAPAKLMDYSNMLYPQYAYKFEKTISLGAWEHLQKEAKNFLAEKGGAHEDVIKHWQSIVDGNIPFGYLIKEEK